MEGESSTRMKTEVSDSDNSNGQSSRSGKLSRQSSGSSQYRGVVYQQNGHWGAQIYANHQRIWLGTFKTEAAAAGAYDSAALKVRNGESSDQAPPRNFPVNELTKHELTFQASYSTDQVLNMIKDGSYETRFNEYISSISQGSNHPYNQNNLNNEIMHNGVHRQELFRKELTPSDVGKLNRLVIPKRHAVNHFPSINTEGGEQGGGIELPFEDTEKNIWRFSYCYWQSSQSFVFTRGWNKFVQKRNLEANDIVIFYSCSSRDNNGNVRKFYMIDTAENNSRRESNNNQGESSNNRGESPSNDGDKSEENTIRKIEQGETSGSDKEAKGIRIFGVDLMPNNCNEES